MSRQEATLEPRTICADDMMRKDVLVLRQTQPTSEAIEMLEDAGVSGAPVVDGAGAVVGVLSLSDIACSDHVREGRLVESWSEESMAFGAEDEEDEEVVASMLSAKDGYSSRVRRSDTVGDWMNRSVLSIAPSASLREVCASMIAHGVHRLLVVEDRKLLGIVTTMDVVRVIAERG